MGTRHHPFAPNQDNCKFCVDAMVDHYHSSATGIRGQMVIDGQMYIPASPAQGSREYRSRVLRFNDESIKGVDVFKYAKLPSMRRRIRLLRLKAGTLDNPQIECELFEVEYDEDNVPRETYDKSGAQSSKRNRAASASSIKRESAADDGDGDETSTDEEKVEYEALSWCWGMESTEYAIMIRKGRKQFRLAATRELALALKYLRSSRSDRTLWIDAICINQKDPEERNQ